MAEGWVMQGGVWGGGMLGCLESMKFGRESDQDTCHHCCLNFTGEAMRIDSSMYCILLFLFFYHDYVYSRLVNL